MAGFDPEATIALGPLLGFRSAEEPPSAAEHSLLRRLYAFGLARGRTGSFWQLLAATASRRSTEGKTAQ